MPTRPKISEAEILEQYRVAIDNALKQPDIASALARFGYDAATIAQGEELLNKAVAAYNANKTGDDEKAKHHQIWTELKNRIARRYSVDRKIAKLIFRQDPVAKEKLGVKGALPRSYVNWLETVKKYYSVATKDPHIISALKKLNVAPEYLTQTLHMITDLDTARAQYLKTVGEAQDATKAKNAALAKINHWMQNFYALAKIALKDRPQLLEALGKFVRS
ncbi:hypothetical protein ACT29H_15835 [Thermophagus sp. OGC60D27]|uniref:hypothetical protein n=1 Tax=Thermophagus sp. OGC60D27 TaxID=3458415 RepID=UPI0040376826